LGVNCGQDVRELIKQECLRFLAPEKSMRDTFQGVDNCGTHMENVASLLKAAILFDSRSSVINTVD
jgi:hypothetical protein